MVIQKVLLTIKIKTHVVPLPKGEYGMGRNG